LLVLLRTIRIKHVVWDLAARAGKVWESGVLWGEVHLPLQHETAGGSALSSDSTRPVQIKLLGEVPLAPQPEHVCLPSKTVLNQTIGRHVPDLAMGPEDPRLFRWQGRPMVLYTRTSTSVPAAGIVCDVVDKTTTSYLAHLLAPSGAPPANDWVTTAASYLYRALRRGDSLSPLTTPWKHLVASDNVQLLLQSHLTKHEKNWCPFVYNGTLYLSHTMEPHEVMEFTGAAVSQQPGTHSAIGLPSPGAQAFHHIQPAAGAARRDLWHDLRQHTGGACRFTQWRHHRQLHLCLSDRRSRQTVRSLPIAV